jgi:hypothetical protein
MVVAAEIVENRSVQLYGPELVFTIHRNIAVKLQK